MIALFFVTCLAHAPLECEERSLAYLEPLTPMTCLMQAQPELARWSAEHPNWRILRWRCETLRDRELKA